MVIGADAGSHEREELGFDREACVTGGQGGQPASGGQRCTERKLSSLGAEGYLHPNI